MTMTTTTTMMIKGCGHLGDLIRCFDPSFVCPMMEGRDEAWLDREGDLLKCLWLVEGIHNKGPDPTVGCTIHGHKRVAAQDLDRWPIDSE